MSKINLRKNRLEFKLWRKYVFNLLNEPQKWAKIKLPDFSFQLEGSFFKLGLDFLCPKPLRFKVFDLTEFRRKGLYCISCLFSFFFFPKLLSTNCSSNICSLGHFLAIVSGNAKNTGRSCSAGHNLRPYVKLPDSFLDYLLMEISLWPDKSHVLKNFVVESTVQISFIF